MATTGTRDAAVGSLVRQASWIIAKMQRRSCGAEVNSPMGCPA